MQPLDPIVVTDEVCALVAALVERLTDPVLDVAPGWELFATACSATAELRKKHGGSKSGSGSVLTIGPVDHVVAHASAATSEFGFLMPVAQIAYPWQRVNRWRRDATIELWHVGWSPVGIDRIVIATSEARIELVIGNARPTPSVSRGEPGGSVTLDDAD